MVSRSFKYTQCRRWDAETRNRVHLHRTLLSLDVNQHATMFQRFRLTPKATRQVLALGVAVPLALYSLTVYTDVSVRDADPECKILVLWLISCASILQCRTRLSGAARPGRIPFSVILPPKQRDRILSSGHSLCVLAFRTLRNAHSVDHAQKDRGISKETSLFKFRSTNGCREQVSCLVHRACRHSCYCRSIGSRTISAGPPDQMQTAERLALTAAIE